jgi:hypothetical protein
MLLREFLSFNRQHSDPVEDDRYLSQHDTTVLRQKDLRKTRLTLEMLNSLRKAGDAREREKSEELGVIRTMYANPPTEGEGTASV